MSEEPDEFQYETSIEGALMVARAISEIAWWERMAILMPLVADELVKAGVSFPKEKGE
jgi:hypothetical protein